MAVAVAITGAVLLPGVSTTTEPKYRSGLQRIADPADKPEKQTVSFNRDIRPIFSDKCSACHGFDDKTREAGLRLDVRDAALAEYDTGTGTAVVPGDPGASTILKRVTSDMPGRVMPPPHTHKPVSAEQVALLRAWIDEGVVYEAYWSLIPPALAALPETEDTVWPRKAVDRFVLAKLEQAGVKPSPEADRLMLIRRVYLGSV